MDEVEETLEKLKKKSKQGEGNASDQTESLLNELGDQLEHIQSFLTPTWLVPMSIQQRYLRLLKSYKHQLKKVYKHDYTSNTKVLQLCVM